MTMQVLREALLLGAIAAAVPLIAWPFLGRLKIWVAVRSLRTQRTSLAARLPAILKAVDNLASQERADMDRALSRFESSLHEMQLEGVEPSRYGAIGAQLEDLRLKLRDSQSPAQKVQLTLSVLPFLLYHASDIGLPSAVPGFPEVRTAGANLSAHMLASPSPVIRRILQQALVD